MTDAVKAAWRVIGQPISRVGAKEYSRHANYLARHLSDKIEQLERELEWFRELKLRRDGVPTIGGDQANKVHLLWQERDKYRQAIVDAPCPQQEGEPDAICYCSDRPEIKIRCWKAEALKDD